MDEITKAVFGLRRTIGKEALTALQRHEATLRIWRRSSPHNWWVQPNDESAMHLWHSWKSQPNPDLSMFDLLEDSDARIRGDISIIGADNGAPEESVYVLKDEYCAIPAEIS